MIICNSHNFVVTRVQRTGGTSLEMYILESGLVDYENDIYTLEGGFSNWQEFKEYSANNNNLKYSELPPSLYGDSLYEAQETFFSLVDKGKISSDMPCIGGVRHPLDWMASLFYYANELRKRKATKNMERMGCFSQEDIMAAKHFSSPDASCDFVLSNLDNPHVAASVISQYKSYPDHAELFNFENLHEHVSEFIARKGGNAPEKKINFRQSENDPTYYLENLSEDRKQRILELHEKDLIIWEKAYAKFN